MSEEKSVEKHKRWPLPSILLAFGFFLLYSLFRTETGYFTRDPLQYYTDIEEGSLRSLFCDPKHLLYSPLGYAVYQLWKWAGWTQGAQIPLQVLNALAGALGVGLFFRLILAIVENTTIALLTSCLLGFSYGYWRYSLEALTYPFASLFFVLTMLVLVRALKSGSFRHFVLLGLVNGLLGLFLMSGVILAIVVLVAVLLQREKAEKVRHYLLYLTVLGASFGIPSLSTVILVFGRYAPVSILDFVIADNLTMKAWAGFGQLDSMTPFRVIVGVANLLIGDVFAMNFLANRPYLRQIVESKIPQAHIPPTIWAEQNSFHAVVCGLLTVLITLGLLLAVVYLITYRRSLWHNNKSTLLICLTWILLFFTLALWRQTANVHNWIPILVPVWVIFALILRNAKEKLAHKLAPRRQYLIVGLFTVTLFAVNFFGSILPAHNPISNWNLRLTLLLKEHVSRRDLVIPLGAGEFRHIEPYIRYYIGCEAIPASALVLGDYPESLIETGIAAKLVAGNRVYVLADVFGSHAGYIHIARAAGLTEEAVGQRLQAVFGRYAKTVVVEERGVPLVYEIVGQ